MFFAIGHGYFRHFAIAYLFNKPVFIFYEYTAVGGSQFFDIATFIGLQVGRDVWYGIDRTAPAGFAVETGIDGESLSI